MYVCSEGVVLVQVVNVTGAVILPMFSLATSGG